MREKVIRYLMEHYAIAEAEAVRIVDKYKGEIFSAEQWGSQPYYPAGNMADAERLKHLDPCAECEKEMEAELRP